MPAASQGALYPAAQLGLRIGARVVENRPLLLHVELAVGVARDACRTRGLNVDLRHAVGGVQYRGALVGRGIRVGHDLRLPGSRPHDQTERRPKPKGQGAHGEKHGAAAHGPGRDGIARGRSGGLAVAGHGFGHGHQQAAGLVEDDAVTVLVHAKSCLRMTS